jgi:putative membrane protein
VVAGLATAALAVVSAAAQDGNADRMMQPDSGFMTAAAQGGMAEVEMGKLALQRASNQKVKDFGQHMIDDHTAGNENLKRVASKKGVTLPAEINARQKATMAKLSRLSGAAFDRAYMADMVADHKEDVAEFQREANEGKDTDVKGFAQETLPTLQSHLRMAEEAQNDLKK